MFTDKNSAEEYISKTNPDQGSSSLAENQLSKEPLYDLLIIVPVYNVEKYVEECIDSIINQRTAFSFRIVIVNDGSKDNSRQLLQKYEEISNVSIIDQQNKGFSGARNTALEYIASRYVMFVDSDDRLCDDCINDLLSAAFGGNYDIVEGGYRLFNDDGYVLRVYSHSHEEKAVPSMLHGQAWGKVYKSALFEHVCFPVGYWFEDTVTKMIIYRLAARIMTLPNIVYDYRNNALSITNTSKTNKKSVDTYWITKRLLSDASAQHLLDSSDYYEQMLVQCIHNGRRFLSLGDERLFAALLVAEKSLIDQFFIGHQKSKSKRGQLMEQFIQCADYRRFRLALLFLWDDI